MTVPGTRVVDLAWNPMIRSALAVVYSNGALGMFTFRHGAEGRRESKRPRHICRR